MRLAVTRAITAARAAGRIKPEHEPYAALARKAATAVDAPDVSIADLTRLSTQITALLSRLPLSEEAPGDRPPTASGGAGEDSPHTAGLAVVVGSGPTVGDTALPG